MNTIIFRITLKREYGGFAAVSNFIAKMENKIEMTAEELRGVTSFLHRGNELDVREAATISYRNREKFLTVSKPENLISGTKGYRLAYCICVDDESSFEDVVEWHYYVLMKKYYNSSILCTVIDGSRDMYHKISHYLYELSWSDKDFYNSVYFITAGKLQRLQKENVEKLKDFVPLLYINKELLISMRKPLCAVIEKKDIEECIMGKLNIQSLDYSPYMKGCLELLLRFSDIIDVAKRTSFVEKMCENNLLTFILFSYSFYDCLKKERGRRTKEDILKAGYLYQQISECANGCLQLIENVVLHATCGTGVLSIRFHSRKTPYLLKRYSEHIQQIPHLEILISDYSGGLNNKNIAENFKDNITMPLLREKFHSLCPLDFIEGSSEDEAHRVDIEVAFQDYYTYSEHIGKHYGLKIFQNILKRNDGIFSFCSHSSSQCMPGESWNLKENLSDNKYAQCIPGTSYAVLFPLKLREEQVSKMELGIEENYILYNNLSYYMKNYKGLDYVLEESSSLNLTQQEKEKNIQRMAKQLQNQPCMQEDKKCVIYISVRDFNTDYAEYLCKALLLAGYNDKNPDFVLYGCSEEFMALFLQTIAVYFKMGTLKYAFQKNNYSIALFTAKATKELILIPQSIEKTYIANKLSGFSGDEIYQNDWLFSNELQVKTTDDKEMLELPPYDIIHKISVGEGKQTLFESYVLQVLDTDIQCSSFGCKISETHMRLGSTIHIDSFYEAELLYSSRLFVSRFAYLLAKKIMQNKDFQKSAKITLYSYALYSELFIVKTISILEDQFPKKSIDYAILEREAEHRGFKHIDRIRFSHFFDSSNDSEENDNYLNYFADRKIICIVPINSTLKTHEKLIDMFCQKIPSCTIDNFIMNFAIILVGSKESNKYWTIDEKNKTFLDINLEIRPIPQYFVTVKVEYQEASECKMCFPDNPLNETPLIEVNAASTIPNQSFGLCTTPTEKLSFDWEWIKEMEEELNVLKNSLIYSHVKRGENHFSMYFQTDRLFIENKDNIVKWLGEIKNEIKIDLQEQHILVCPSHFSNAGFLEHINQIIFHDSALIIRMDADKEYRCNMEAKYSSLQEFIKMLSQRNDSNVIHIYYVDDCIITGRTYHRTRSLVSSALGIYTDEYPELDIRLFDRIFVLLDRNSTKTRMQYLETDSKENHVLTQQQARFFAYRTLHISSLRNHGDSCIVCQLEKKDRILYQTSTTALMANHWKKERKRHKVRFLADKAKDFTCNFPKEEQEKRQKKQDRAFRRMFCTHIVNTVLNEKYYGNQKSLALNAILTLLLIDYNGRKENSQEEAFEYLLSYFKVMSRPFISFSKPIREAVFDIILICLEYLLTANFSAFTKDLLTSKPYLRESKSLFERINKEIIGTLANPSQRKDFLLVLMKQSMELRSNYFIRPENIRKLSCFVKEYDEKKQKKIYNQYLYLVKKLVGDNTDTSKSAWFNAQLSNAEVRRDFMGLPRKVFSLLYIENIRAYYDGIERLSEEKDSSLKFLNEELNKYQYRDFKLTIQECGWVNGEGVLTAAGHKALVSAITLFHTASTFPKLKSKENEKKDIRTFCRDIVKSIINIVEAQDVYLILELPMECDLWEDDIKREFNQLLPNHMANMRFLLENKKEYLVIASNNDPDKTTAFPMEKEAIIKKYHQNRFASKCGFMIDVENHCLVWEIGQEGHHSLIFYVEFQRSDYDHYLMWARNIMSVSFYFNEYVFNERTRINLYELMLSDKERLLYNITKWESHMEDDIKIKQYEDVQNYSSNKQELYHSYILTLLKDLQVSDVYRPSLHRKFYGRDLKITSYTWEKTPIEFNKECTKLYVAATQSYNYIKLNVYTKKLWFPDDKQLDYKNELIAFDIADGVRRPFLMILALIMNAAVEDRAEMQSFESDFKVASVDVYLSRTPAGGLRILNFSNGEGKNIEQIRREMLSPPGPDSGISLWSMSRYIKSIVSRLTINCLDKYREVLADCSMEEQKKLLLELRSFLDDLLSDSYMIKVDGNAIDSKKYFSVEIPILAEKYEKYREYFKQKPSKE